MIRVAPSSLAPAVAQRPIGPWAKTATVSPILMPPFSAPTKPVDMMSGHISTSSSLRSSGTGARFAIASGTRTYSAWQPSMVLPNFQPPIGFQPCRVPAPSCAAEPAEAGVGPARGGDRPGDDALALGVAADGGTELFDDADGFVTDGQALGDGILTLEDVDVGAADRRGRDADQRVHRADIGDGLVLENDPVVLDEDSGFHLAGHDRSLRSRPRAACEALDGEKRFLPFPPFVTDRCQMNSITSSMLPKRMTVLSSTRTMRP